MRLVVKLDVAALAVGTLIGVLIAPYIYDTKRMKQVAKVGAVKEVVKETKRGLFRRKDK